MKFQLTESYITSLVGSRGGAPFRHSFLLSLAQISLNNCKLHLQPFLNVPPKNKRPHLGKEFNAECTKANYLSLSDTKSTAKWQLLRLLEQQIQLSVWQAKQVLLGQEGPAHIEVIRTIR